ncbi:hypothetical protein [Tunturiibacter gelidoferens]|jgi:hypothetical protein|uniref:Uncharacterized protein n=1 Tax=Tunturiibacter gelidiferens TaxID=3069689 RepID=A0A9X0QGS4_9BACT|nr:hypothetical protein [Edaphobacter lichenicola]MBB5330122.1 hypothetical protein [Edaphobacter lichenicola]
MHTFSLHLRHESPDGPWIASCPVQADLEGFSGLTRSFASEGAMAIALEAAGVKIDRSREALDEVHNGQASSLEISQNEAQKLGILHTDSPE